MDEPPPSPPTIIPIASQSQLLDDLLQSYACADVCVIGRRGSGKSTIVELLRRQLGQTVEPLVMYQDMTARDLLQQRTTQPNGNTVWQDSALVRAAKCGHIALLDGIHRCHYSTMSLLHRLVHDRELQLYDGTRLLRADKFDALMVAHGWTMDDMRRKGVVRISPTFRIVALAEPPDVAATAPARKWFTPELCSMFVFHECGTLTRAEEHDIIDRMYGSAHNADLERLLGVAHWLRDRRDDPTMRQLADTLSTRQLLRIAHRLAAHKTVRKW